MLMKDWMSMNSSILIYFFGRPESVFFIPPPTVLPLSGVKCMPEALACDSFRLPKILTCWIPKAVISCIKGRFRPKKCVWIGSSLEVLVWMLSLSLKSEQSHRQRSTSRLGGWMQISSFTFCSVFKFRVRIVFRYGSAPK